ncbi:MAG: hypothetical protein H7311_14065, partial [Ramlibacter sp.]|nr:hypothetical protein [Cryobacterium sp.]
MGGGQPPVRVVLTRGPSIANLLAVKNSSSSILRKTAALALGLVLAGFALTAIPLAPASADATDGIYGQCNYSDNTPGLAAVCDITVTNNLDLSTGVASAVVTTNDCHGTAGAPPVAKCALTTTELPYLVKRVEQCNNSVNGGGGDVICNVMIVNNITGAATTADATVNQCIGSGTGDTALPAVDCTPVQETSGATVTQCNGSGNGGGAPNRVECDVLASTFSPEAPVTINQCNDSSNGGGNTVTCTSRMTTNVLTASLVSTPTPTASAEAVAAAPQLAATGFDSGPLLLSTASALLLGGLVV